MNPIDYTQPQLIEAEIVETDPKLASGPPCRACGAPRDPMARFCVACGLPFEVPSEALRKMPRAGSSSVSREKVAGVASQPTTSPTPSMPTLFRCDGCGAEVSSSQDQRSFTCPFCDSHYVQEIAEHTEGRQRPEFIIGFAIDHQRAQELFFEWLGKNNWFRPSDLKDKALTDKQRGVYLPFWHFSMHAESQWSASIGEYWYRTETYTVTDSKGKRETRTRQVQETEWWPLSGTHQKYYSGFLVSASKGLPQREAMAIQPYQLASLVRYRPFYLAGWMTEEYSLDASQAIGVAQQEFQRRQELEVARFLPGDTNRNLRVSTNIESTGSDLILLPVHVLSYRYRNRQFRFLVNGQTGKYYGEKPWSSYRIAFFVILIILFVVLSGLVIFMMMHQSA